MSNLTINHLDDHPRLILLSTRPTFQVILTVFALIVILLFGLLYTSIIRILVWK